LSDVLLLTAGRDSAAEILPSLSLLPHAVRIAPPSPAVVMAHAAGLAAPGVAMPGAQSGKPDSAVPDIVLVDARRDLVRVKELLRQIGGAGLPVVAVISEGAWAAVSADWGAQDVILNTAGPGEVDARIRLAIGRSAARQTQRAEEVRSGELVIDEATYSARIRGAALDLTFKEFELLKYLAQHPRHVFTRSQLLQEVWGYDYFGGTRTVDVHVRRLRAKLGPENEALIGTVRNVGYKFVPASPVRHGTASGPRPNGADHDADAQYDGAADDNGAGDSGDPDADSRETARGRAVGSRGNWAGP
jgi:DNA-binding response OmpR family regulator